MTWGKESMSASIRRWNWEWGIKAINIEGGSTKMFPKRQEPTGFTRKVPFRVCFFRDHPGLQMMAMFNLFQWCWRETLYPPPRSTYLIFKWYWRRIDICVCIYTGYIYIYIHLRNSMTVVDTKFVTLATVFTIFWLEAGWNFGFCGSSFCFLENNQPFENPSPNHPRRERPSYDARVPTGESFPRLHRAHQAKDLVKVWWFLVGVVYIGKFCIGGWNQTNQWFLWKDGFWFFCSNFKKDRGMNETWIWWNVI